MTETGTEKDYGFLSKDLNGFGEFQTTSDPDQRAIFSINLADAAQGKTNIVVVSDPPQMTAVCPTLTLSRAQCRTAPQPVPTLVASLGSLQPYLTSELDLPREFNCNRSEFVLTCFPATRTLDKPRLARSIHRLSRLAIPSVTQPD